LYNLGAEAGEEQETSHRRIFDILVNGEVVIPSLEPVNHFGELRAAHKKIILKASDNSGVEIRFRAIQGNPILNAIEMKKLY
jgi:beta-galactosidase